MLREISFNNCSAPGELDIPAVIPLIVPAKRFSATPSVALSTLVIQVIFTQDLSGWPFLGRKHLQQPRSGKTSGERVLDDLDQVRLTTFWYSDAAKQFASRSCFHPNIFGVFPASCTIKADSSRGGQSKGEQKFAGTRCTESESRFDVSYGAVSNCEFPLSSTVKRSFAIPSSVERCDSAKFARNSLEEKKV
jgi:hypothetical protein